VMLGYARIIGLGRNARAGAALTQPTALPLFSSETKFESADARFRSAMARQFLPGLGTSAPDRLNPWLRAFA
jgi:hypothetical protein